MLPGGYGKIVNMASMSGHISNTAQNQSHYNASKADVITGNDLIIDGGYCAW